MNRRDLLKLITTATGVAFVGSAMAYDIRPSVSLKDTDFSKDEVTFLNEIAEVIIPRTVTPGAKDANVGEIMAILVSDCYTQDLQKVFREGMTTLDNEARQEQGKDFLLLSKTDKQALLSRLDKEAKQANTASGLDDMAMASPNSRWPDSKKPLPHYFSLFKQLTLFGFFTSEVGGTKVLRYVPVPGKYDGNIDYKKGQTAWAT